MGKNEEGRGPRVKRSKGSKVQGFQGPGVPRSQGPKDQDISNSHSNTSLTLKKVHLVIFYYHTSLRLHGQNVATDCFKYCDSLQAVQPCEPFRFQLIVSI